MADIIRTSSDDMSVGLKTSALKLNVNFRTGGGGGAPGRGIASLVQTTESDEDEGINVWTATMTDGNTSEFHVRNGSRGSKGDKGDPGESGGGGSSTGYIGQYATLQDLQQIAASAGMYAYVGTAAPYAQYAYNGTSWVPTGITTNDIGAASGDRDTSKSSKGYVHVPINLVQKNIVKTYPDVTWVHDMESAARTKSTATAAASYDSATEYFEGNPTSRYGTAHGFPEAGNASVRKSAPYCILNTADNKVYFKWQYYIGDWTFQDICYDGWGEAPQSADFSVTSGKTFAYVKEGVTHYAHYNGTSWEIDATEQANVNYLAPTTFSTPDTIYEIAYDMDLCGETITLASGVVLKYAGGKIKNGMINCAEGTVIDCPDVQFFQNVRIMNMDGHVLKDVWFDDIFMAVAGRKSYSSPCTAISLSRDYTIDFRHNSFSFKYVRGDSTLLTHKLTIYGNGHKLNVDDSFMYSYQFLFLCRYLEVHDLSIQASETEQVYDTIFNAKNVQLYNVTYRGCSRFSCNHARETDNDSALVVNGCDIRVVAFAFEAMYNKVRFDNSRIAWLNPGAGERKYTDIISVGCNLNSKAESANCNVEVRNCYIGGGWEYYGNKGLAADGETFTTSTSSIASYHGYDYIKFFDCELVRFSIGRRSNPRKPGNTDVLLSNCRIRQCGYTWGITRINSFTVENCYITLFKDNVGGTSGGAFPLWNINEATFKNNTIAKEAYTDRDVTSLNGTAYPHGYTYEPGTDSACFVNFLPDSNNVEYVSSSSRDGQLISDWDFKLYLIGNRVIANGDTSSNLRIRCTNPLYTDNPVVLTAAQAKSIIVCQGNKFVKSAEGASVAGCHAHLDSKANVLPFDNTIFTNKSNNYNLTYAAANFGYCNVNFDFKVITGSVPLHGRFNASTGMVSFLQYTNEQSPGTVPQ